MKKCIECKKVKPLNEYHKSGFNKDGSQKYRLKCAKCFNSDWRYGIMRNVCARVAKHKKYDGVIRKSKTKHKNLTISFLDELRTQQNGMCFWLNIPLDFTLKDSLRKPSLDRLDNSKGYEASNVVLSTTFANYGRNSSSVSEMKDFLSNYL